MSDIVENILRIPAALVAFPHGRRPIQDQPRPPFCMANMRAEMS